jgi:hypothetical protein
MRPLGHSLFDEAPAPELLPPPPARPTLVTRDGAFARGREEFTVHVSEADPNAWRGMGKCLVFRKKTKEEEDYGKALVRRIMERTAKERHEAR